MNKKNKANPTAQLALLIATMVVIEVLSQTIFAAFALPIKPTLTHIPVIIASIVYGPKIGAYLGGFMGIMSIVRNTIVYTVGSYLFSPFEIMSIVRNTIVYTVGSYLFSPFVEGGTWASAVIAIVPRILIGIFPYFIYKLLQNRLGLMLSGVLGAFTNTFFVLLGIYFLIPNFYSAGGKTLMATIFTINSVAEMVIAGLLTLSITPMLLRLKK
ncbi:MAG: ECF transporter S component [Streptococcus thermophilus]